MPWQSDPDLILTNGDNTAENNLGLGYFALVQALSVETNAVYPVQAEITIEAIQPSPEYEFEVGFYTPNGLRVGWQTFQGLGVGAAVGISGTSLVGTPGEYTAGQTLVLIRETATRFKFRVAGQPATEWYGDDSTGDTVGDFRLYARLDADGDRVTLNTEGPFLDPAPGASAFGAIPGTPTPALFHHQYAIEVPAAHPARFHHRYAIAVREPFPASFHHQYGIDAPVGMPAQFEHGYAIAATLPAPALFHHRYAIAVREPHPALFHHRYAIAATAAVSPGFQGTGWRCVLTGAADGTTDLVLPIRNFQIRLYHLRPSFLSVTVPAAAGLIDGIAARLHGDLVLDRVWRWTDGYTVSREIARGLLDGIPTYDLSPRAYTATLTARRIYDYSADPQAVDPGRQSYRRVTGGDDARPRFAYLDDRIRPLDTITLEGIGYVVNEVAAWGDRASVTMELGCAVTADPDPPGVTGAMPPPRALVIPPDTDLWRARQLERTLRGE